MSYSVFWVWVLNMQFSKSEGTTKVQINLKVAQSCPILCDPTQYASKFGKLSSGHRTGKGQFSFQSLRKAIPKNAQTTTQLHSAHMLVK